MKRKSKKTKHDPKKIRMIAVSFVVLLLALVSVLAYTTYITKSYETNAIVCAGTWYNCDKIYYKDNLASYGAAKYSSDSTNNPAFVSILEPIAIPEYQSGVTSSKVSPALLVKTTMSFSNQNARSAFWISADGGKTFGPKHVIGGPNSYKDYVIDVSKDRQWTADDFGDGKIVVKFNCYKFDSLGVSGYCYNDAIKMEIKV